MELPVIRKDGLQLDEHRRFQEKFWTAERAAWIVFGLIVLAALSGATGSGGMLSSASIEMAGATMDYPRIARWQTGDRITVRLKADSLRSERSLTFSKTFTQAFQIEDIQPQPIRTTTAAHGQTLYFDNPTGDGGVIAIAVRADSIGIKRFELATDQSEAAALTTYVLP